MAISASISTELDTSISAELDTSISAELDTSISAELDTSISAELDTSSGQRTPHAPDPNHYYLLDRPVGRMSLTSVGTIRPYD